MAKQLPVKTSSSIDMVLKTALKSLESAKTDVDPTSASNSVVAFFLTAIAETLFSEGQQEHVQVILAMWKDCRYGDRRSEAVVEMVRPDVMQAHRAK